MRLISNNLLLVEWSPSTSQDWQGGIVERENCSDDESLRKILEIELPKYIKKQIREKFSIIQKKAS